MRKLYYVFRREWQSCANPDMWLRRSYAPIKVWTEDPINADDTRIIAGRIAAGMLKADESGVRVTLLGIQAGSDADITPMGNFTLTLVRGGGV